MNRRPVWRWMAGLTLLFALINHPLILGRAAPIWDARASFFPFFVLVADHARAGRLVAWDVWSEAGLPRIGDPEFGALAPVQLLVGLAFGGTTHGFIAYWLLIWWLGGLGIFLLGRHLAASAPGAAIVALGYLFSGVYTGHAEHLSWLVAFSALPFVVWRLDVALVRRRSLPAVESGAIWGVSALGGYPGLTVVTGLFLAVWVLGRIGSGTGGGEAGEDPGAESVPFSVCTLAVAALVALCIMLPTYYSFFYEGAGVHARTSALSREVVVSNNALDPAALVTAVSPYFAGLKFHRSQTLWPGTDVSSCSVYSGAVVLVLALAALAAYPANWWHWYLMTATLAMLAVAVGDALPFRGWLYDWVYPTRFFRHAAMFRLYAVFLLAVLALRGVNAAALALTGRSPQQLRIAGAAMLVTAVAVVTHYLMLRAVGAGAPGQGLAHAHVLVVWGGLAVVAAATCRNRGSGVLPVPLMALVLGLAVSDAVFAAAMTRDTVYSRRPADVSWWQRQNSVHLPNLRLSGLERTRWGCESNPPCEMPNTWGMISKLPALDTYTPISNAFYETVKTHPMLSAGAMRGDRMWLAREVAELEPTAEAFDAFVERTERLGAPPVVIHRPEAMLRGQSGPSAGVIERIRALPRAVPIGVQRLSYDTDTLAFTVHMPHAGLLLVTDRWARSWKATVDDRPTGVAGGNFVFRAVWVPAGAHRVRFDFHPAALPWLLVTGWGTLLAVTLVSLVAHRGRTGSRLAGDVGLPERHA